MSPMLAENSVVIMRKGAQGLKGDCNSSRRDYTYYP